MESGRAAGRRGAYTSSEEGVQNASQAAGEGYDGDLFPTARRDASGPGLQLLRLRGATAEDRDGGLNQEPAGARMGGLGDGASALGLARAVLARHEAEVGCERRMGNINALRRRLQRTGYPT